MAVLLTERVERPATLFGPGPETCAPESHRPHAADSSQRRSRAGGLGGGLTLDDAIVGVWEGLAAQTAVACPLCDGALRPHAEGDVLGGRCGDCGTTLS